jgi:hypothetical protein
MTGAESSSAWPIPIRVDLAPDAKIELHETGQEGVPFSRDTISRMFEIGLMQPPRSTERDPEVPTGVTLTGDARFLVGQVDLGAERGMEVLVRGLEAAVDASYRDLRDRPPRVEPDQDSGEDPVPGQDAFDEPDLLGLSREVVVPLDDAGDRLDDLLDEIEQGGHVVLDEDGKRVGVMMSWPAYVELRRKLAGMATAFWSAWHTGVFDVAGYATAVTQILHRRPEPEPNPSSSDEEGHNSEGGSDDETY